VTDMPPLDLPRLIGLVWGELMKQQRFQSAALVTLLAYLLSREQEDEELAAGWQPLLLKAIDELRAKPKAAGADKPACSFCGRAEPEVRLGAGAGAFICDGCVATFSEVFGTKPGA
jgi:ClpX C4-type zinc finger